jgi:CRISPR-associated protein Cmr2
MSHRLHFTFGPVQSFVAQSRRTRDLYISSYILSHLARKAMLAAKRAAEQTGGQLLLPHPDALAPPSAIGGATYGSLPNRFVVEGGDLPETATSALSAFDEAWLQIANAVFAAFVKPVAPTGRDTVKIWEREVGNFWDKSWAIGDDDALGRRKNWRTSPATVEPGDHCTVMGNWQELSGFIRSRSREERERQDEFWNGLRRQQGVSDLDLDEDERLCAIALIKRLVVNVSKRAFGDELLKNWPSTPYLAAVPWLRALGRCGDAAVVSKARQYAELIANVVAQPFGEIATTLPSLKKSENSQQLSKFSQLDGNFFHQRALENQRVTRFTGSDEGEKRRNRERVQANLRELCKAVGDTPGGFFAVLLMDGDSMGKVLSEARNADREQHVTGALSGFSANAPEVILQHDGIPVFAGGDDVLAFFPMDNVLDCAVELRREYVNRLKNAAGGDSPVPPSISASIVYANYHLPLRTVLRTAHHLVDNVAKEATGRDSLAVGIFKSSGIVCQWSAPWDHLLEVVPNRVSALASKLCRKEKESSAHAGEFSTSFLHNIRECFIGLSRIASEKPGHFEKLIEGIDLHKLLLADHLRAVRRRGATEEEIDRQLSEAEQAVELLVSCSRRVTRSNRQTKPDNNTVGMDGIRLALFLARDGKEGTE